MNQNLHIFSHLLQPSSLAILKPRNVKQVKLTACAMHLERRRQTTAFQILHHKRLMPRHLCIIQGHGGGSFPAI